MKLNRKIDLKKCGIYCMRNIINNKVYIGKSTNIYIRIKQHITALNNKIITQENQHLINAWHKYGKNSFEYIVLEYIDNTIDGYEKTLKEQELYWMKYYNSLINGYNIRYDSSTNTKVNSLTREQQSKNMCKRWKENRNLMISIIKNNWKNISQENLDNMKNKLSKIKTKYYIIQLDKNTNFIKQWNSVHEILLNYPSFKKHNIYSVCSGEKPTMYGFIWKKILKEDIVQS